MSPELLRRDRCSEKVDVYSFGIFLIELYTGKPPYGEDRLRREAVPVGDDWQLFA